MRSAEKKPLVGVTTDSWNIGQKKFKKLLAVHKMTERLQKKHGVATSEVPMWEIVQGPHYDELERLFESYWIPDLTTPNNLLLQFDLTIIPDPVIAKYMVEAYYQKEHKLKVKRDMYAEQAKKPWGVMDDYPPKERYEYERIKNLPKQKWIRKFPPLATCGDESYKRIRHHAQVEYFSYGVEDFALYLPPNLVPSRRVLLLRYRNRFDTLVQSLLLRGINVTSAYPLTWMRKDWSPQEERIARETDVAYFHETHAVQEWVERLGRRGDREAVAACHDEEVARAAKAAGFEHIFFAKRSNTDGLTQTVLQAVEHVKKLNMERMAAKKS